MQDKKRLLNNSTPDSSALGGHQESNKTRAKHPEGHGIRDPGTEFAQKRRSISEQRDEEGGPSSWDPRRPPKDANRHA